ncbi:ABC transporter substrate-binding protein [Pseudonocardia lacus]|uniref:ABC transporter substrate-binding protein n=1 Tax=Pseudonocardia lacus TaxID=2835865 RepID=UPI001BDD7754|nr:ABC transporter substrate-binding protein [Pseudonocardia lacus]
MDRASALRLDRRGFLRTVGAAGAAVAAGGATAACSSGLQGSEGGGGGDTIRIGYVSPSTGPLAPFGEADDFVIGSIQEYFTQNPIKVGDQSYPVEVLKRDSQSDSNRAADVAADLIQNNGIHLMLVSSTPDTSNPVSDQCEAQGMPCVATVTPWQPWFFGRGGQEGTKFQWTFNFFWGLEDVEAVYADMWDEVPTNKKAGALWPNDPDGLAWGDPTTGFAPAQAQRGYSIVDPGNYPNGTQDFSAQITQFKEQNAEILLGVPIPPDFTTFWRQAAQQGYQPKLATVAKALLFPSSVEALGPLGVNLGTEVWWSPSHPFTSSLTGQSAAQLADAYTQATQKQWTQPIGFAHALFEVAAKAFGSVQSIDDKAGLAAAISTMQLETVVGPLDWTSGPVPNVAKTPVVGGQWRTGTDFAFDLTIVSNKQAPGIPTAGEVQPLGAAVAG